MGKGRVLEGRGRFLGAGVNDYLVSDGFRLSLSMCKRSFHDYHLHVPTVLKSGSLNLLEPSGSVQDCNGIVLPLALPYSVICTGCP